MTLAPDTFEQLFPAALAGVDAAAAEVDEASIVQRIAGEDHAAVLKALRPLGPAARGVFSAHGEYGSAV